MLAPPAASAACVVAGSLALPSKTCCFIGIEVSALLLSDSLMSFACPDDFCWAEALSAVCDAPMAADSEEARSCFSVCVYILNIKSCKVPSLFIIRLIRESISINKLI